MSFTFKCYLTHVSFVTATYLQHLRNTTLVAGKKNICHRKYINECNGTSLFIHNQFQEAVSVADCMNGK